MQSLSKDPETFAPIVVGLGKLDPIFNYAMDPNGKITIS